MSEKTESRAQWVASLAAVLLVSEIVAAKATRDALFLSQFGPAHLPQAMLGASLSALLIAFVATSLVRRVGPLRSSRALLLLNALLLFAQAASITRHPVLIVVLLYLQVASLGAVVVSGFWSAVTDRFDPHTARSAVTRIAAGASLGGLLGGLCAAPLLRNTSVPVLLAVLGGLQVLAALLLEPLDVATKPRRSGELGSGAFAILAHSGYLQRLGGLVALVALFGTLLDYVFKVRAAASFADTSTLLSFFGLFYTLTSVLAAAVQLFLTRRALEGVGLGGMLAALPGFVALLALLALGLPEMWPLVLLRGGANVLENSLYRSAYEPLYTPLAPEKKRALKTILDVAAERSGDLIGAGLLLVAATLVPSKAAAGALVVAAVAAAGGLLLSLALHNGYVRELAKSLRLGVVTLNHSDVHDRTTRLTLSQTAVDLDRDALLLQIAELREGAGAAHLAALRQSAETLLSNDRALIEPALEQGLDPAIVALALPLLARDDLVEPVTAALREVAPRVVGTLSDALLDARTPGRVRRRIPRVLEAASGERAIAALSDALADDEFEVRLRAGLALRTVLERSARRLPLELVFQAVQREVDAHVGQSARSAAAADTTVGDAPLKHVFTLLSLALDREPVELSFRALDSEDPKLRGTALEYLENVLPARVRDALWPHVGGQRPKPKGTDRPQEQIVDDLRRSFDGLSLAGLEKGAAEGSKP